MRNLNFNGEPGSEPYTLTAQGSGGFSTSDGFYSPEFRGDFGAGLLDLHSMDDTELLSEVQKTTCLAQKFSFLFCLLLFLLLIISSPCIETLCLNDCWQCSLNTEICNIKLICFFIHNYVEVVSFS